MRDRIRNEAEWSRFDSKMKGEGFKLRISYGLSDIDPLTNIKYFWDIWIRFPISIPKDDEKFEKFKELVNRAFKDTFLI